MRGLERAAVGATLTAALLTACGWSGPAPECDQSEPNGSATISCQEAVSLARAQLSASHPGVTRIQFLYGSYQPIFPAFGSQGAYVVFTFSDSTRQAVQLWLSNGKVVAESPGAY